MKLMKGVIVPMTTPFTEHDSVDAAALSENTRWLIDRGINCLYPCGTTGEMLLMDNDERKRVAETVVEAAQGRADVFVQCGAMTTRDTLELIRHAKSIGAAGVGVVTPAYFGLSAEEMLAHFQAASRCAGEDFPIYLYNIPQCAANDLTTEICGRIVETCPNVLGIKYSFSNADRISEYLSLRNYHFSVLVGLEKHFLPYLALGCDGVVSGCAHAFPELFLGIYNAFLAGNYPEALRLQRIAEKLVGLISGPQSNARVKAAQRYRGLNGGHMRRPLLDLSAADEAAFHARLDAFLPENW